MTILLGERNKFIIQYCTFFISIIEIACNNITIIKKHELVCLNTSFVKYIAIFSNCLALYIFTGTEWHRNLRE